MNGIDEEHDDEQPEPGAGREVAEVAAEGDELVAES